LWTRIQPRGYLLQTSEQATVCLTKPEQTRRTRFGNAGVSPPSIIRYHIYHPTFQLYTRDPRRIKRTKRLFPPAVVGPGIYFAPIVVKRNVLYRRNFERQRASLTRIFPLIVANGSRVEIPVNEIIESGLNPLVIQISSDAINNHYFINIDKTYLEIVSTDSGSQSITVVSSATVDELAVADLTITIPAGATRLAGPFNTYTFNQFAAGDSYGAFKAVLVNPSVSGTLKFRAFRLP